MVCRALLNLDSLGLSPAAKPVSSRHVSLVSNRPHDTAPTTSTPRRRENGQRQQLQQDLCAGQVQPPLLAHPHPLSTYTLRRAILDMKNQRDKLHQYQKRITVVTSREEAIARECVRRGDKPRALLALRRKKYQETLLQKTDQQLAQLEALTSDVEFALVQKDVVFGLQQGTAVLKEIHKEMGGIDKVEMIMGETADAQAYQRVRTRGGSCRCTGLMKHRKSPICSVAGCPTTTKTTLKTSSLQWSVKLSPKHQICPTCPVLSLTAFQTFLRRQQKKGLREGRRKELRKLSQSQPDTDVTDFPMRSQSCRFGDYVYDTHGSVRVV